MGTEKKISELVFTLQKAIPEAVSGRPVKLAYLYGSSASGKTTPLSDFDIALFLDPNQIHTIDPYSRLIFEMDVALALEKLTGLSEFDVRVINDAPLMLQGIVVQRGHLLYSDEDEFRVGYETLTLKMYLDFLPIAEQFQTAYFERRRAELRALREKGWNYD